MDEVQHLSICLIEELSEVQKAITKSLRFGYDDLYERKSNLEYVKQEFLDVFVILDKLLDLEIDLRPDSDDFEEAFSAKEIILDSWMDYSRSRGRLDV